MAEDKPDKDKKEVPFHVVDGQHRIAAQALASLGAAKGGRARANVLTPEERHEIARQAVRARWMKAGKSKDFEIAKDGDEEDDGLEAVPDSAKKPDTPYSMFPGKLRIGDVELE